MVYTSPEFFRATTVSLDKYDHEIREDAYQKFLKQNIGGNAIEGQLIQENPVFRELFFH